MSVPSVLILNSPSLSPWSLKLMETPSLIDISPAAKCWKKSPFIRTKWSTKILKTTPPKLKTVLFKSLTSTENVSSTKAKKIPSKSSESSKPIKTPIFSSTIPEPEPNSKELLICQFWARAPAFNLLKILFQLHLSPKKEKLANFHVKSWMRPPFKMITTWTLLTGLVKIIWQSAWPQVCTCGMPEILKLQNCAIWELLTVRLQSLGH